MSILWRPIAVDKRIFGGKKTFRKHVVKTSAKVYTMKEKPVGRVAQRRPRRDARVHKNLALTLIVKSEGEERSQAAFASDISDHGLRIQTAPGLVSGQQVYIFSRERGTQFGACRIVWTRTIEQGRNVEAGLEVLR